MKNEIIDINKFKVDNDFYDKLTLLLTIKSFDLQSIRKRYIKSRKNISKRAGSVERREAGMGGIVKVTIEKGIITEQEILARLPEPRGIAILHENSHSKNMLGIASENIVFLIQETDVTKIKNPWFSYIHTIGFSPFNPDHLVIASSGLDCIFEYNNRTLKKIDEWFAWENGFNKAIDPKSGSTIFLTRSRNSAELYEKEGKKVVLVEDPDKRGLPTAMRAAFINSVTYDTHLENNMLATFFHIGMVALIDKTTKVATPVLTDLTNPHGGMNYGGGYMATSTGSGEVVIGNQIEQKRYSFCKLPGKPDFLKEMEWLQTSSIFKNNIVTIDSNRTSFVIFNPERKCYSRILFNNNWAIQDMVIAKITDNHRKQIKEMFS